MRCVVASGGQGLVCSAGAVEWEVGCSPSSPLQRVCEWAAPPVRCEGSHETQCSAVLSGTLKGSSCHMARQSRWWLDLGTPSNVQVSAQEPGPVVVWTGSSDAIG